MLERLIWNLLVNLIEADITVRTPLETHNHLRCVTWSNKELF